MEAADASFTSLLSYAKEFNETEKKKCFLVHGVPLDTLLHVSPSRSPKSATFGMALPGVTRMDMLVPEAYTYRDTYIAQLNIADEKEISRNDPITGNDYKGLRAEEQVAAK